MPKFCVDISDIDDARLEFFGYRLEEESEEFKIYRDIYNDYHIVSKSRPLLFVEDVNDATYLAATFVIALPDDI